MTIERLQATGWDNFETMENGQPSGATIHRIRPSDHGFDNTARGVRDLYRDQIECRNVAKASIPFHIVIEPSGQVVQTAPLTQRLWHAYKLNATHLGVGCVGDFREHAMPQAQRASLLGVCVGLIKESHGAIKADNILGHTEHPDGSQKAHWDSPGKLFSMQVFRDDLKQAMQKSASKSEYNFAFTGESFAS